MLAAIFVADLRVIDWDFARSVPLQVAVCFPLLVTIMPDNTPKHPLTLADCLDDSYTEGRHYCLETFKEFESFRGICRSSLLQGSGKDNHFRYL